jgi:anti-sigma28 factor (negative regulator of flagellin synthesis)
MAGSSAAETGRAPETQRSERDAAARSGTTQGNPADRVELSSTLGRLSQAIAAQSAQRAQRVEALTNLYQSGRYEPSSQATAGALIAEALSPEGR